MERAELQRWVDEYERLWREHDADGLSRLFSDDAVYLVEPYDPQPMTGLAAIQQFWRDEDDDDEAFTMSSEIVAVEGDVGVVRVEVAYGEPVRQEYRDLWVVELGDDGQCRRFEEWPFWPAKGRSAS